jgi:hypothetical protein
MTDQELAAAFVELVGEDMTGPQADRLTGGVITRNDLSKMRRKIVESFNFEKRSYLTAFVEKPPLERIRAIRQGLPHVPDGNF